MVLLCGYYAADPQFIGHDHAETGCYWQLKKNALEMRVGSKTA